MASTARAARCVRTFAFPLLSSLLAAAPVAAANDGDIDTTFGAAGQLVLDLSANDADEALWAQASIDPGSGKITLGYSIDHASSSEDMGVCDLSASGALGACDEFPFDLGLSDNDSASGIATQLDGRRVLVGDVDTESTGYGNVGVLGLDTTPTIDTLFGGGDGKAAFNLGAPSLARDVKTRREGEIVFTGFYHHEDTSTGTGNDCLVGRLDATGDPDDTFAGDGFQVWGWDLGGTGEVDDECTALALYPGGSVVVAGRIDNVSSVDFGVALLDNAGALDSGFSGNGKRPVAFDLGGSNRDEAKRIAIDRLGRIVVAGWADTATGRRVAVTRLLGGGAFDDTFDGDGKLTFGIAGDDVFDVQGLAVLPPPSNDIALSGVYQSTDTEEQAFVVLLHDDGSFDTSFAGTGKKSFPITGTDPHPRAPTLAVQGGELVVAGVWFNGSAEQEMIWAVRLYRHAIFGDDFESGDRRLWSDRADP